MLPDLRDDELLLAGWIYPTTDHSFAISKRAGVTYKEITTSDREGAPIRLDVATQWAVHADRSLQQAQRSLDAYGQELDEVRRLIFVPHGARWQAPFSGLKHPTTGEPLLRSLLMQRVGNVVATVYPIPDTTALEFNRVFYDSYTRGEGAIGAFQTAVADASRNQDLSGWEGLQIVGRR